MGLDVGDAKADVPKSLTKSKTLVGSADFAPPVEADAAKKQQAKYVGMIDTHNTTCTWHDRWLLLVALACLYICICCMRVCECV